MWTKRLHRAMVMLLLGLLAVGLGFPDSSQRSAEAAKGGFVHKTYFSSTCRSGLGVGIAFDGEYLWYSCYASNPDLFKARVLDGTVVASYNVANGLGALAWDGVLHKIWAGWGRSSTEGKIYLIDPATGSGTVMFTAREAATWSLDDGLAFDASNGNLLVSADVSRTIYKYDSLTGRYLGSFPWTGSGCYNSGLAVGGNLLYQGANGCNHVYVVQKNAPLVRAFDFSTAVTGDPNYRDEDLECDSVTFQGPGEVNPRTVMWSIEAYEPRRAVAFEIPLGSCSTGGGVDSDGDGLLDEWEMHGLWQHDKFGNLQFIDLPAMGADPRKPDIFLHVDWMEESTHNHKIPFAAIKQVVDAFAAAPLSGNWYDSNPPLSSGISRGIGASDLIITLGGATSIEEHAGTLMHELGHNLGLQHGGNDEDNYKPNYLSVMNYSFQFSGVPTYKASPPGSADPVTTSHRLDYSRKALPDRDENRLDELAGLGPDAGNGTEGYGTIHYCTDRRGFGVGLAVDVADDPIDWNCNGTPTDFNNIKADINQDKDSNGKRVRHYSVLHGFDDWAHIRFKTGWIGYAGFAPDLPTHVPEQETISVQELREESRPCTAAPSLAWTAPLSGSSTANVSASATLPIRFSYGACGVFARNESVILQVVDTSQPDLPLTTYVYGSDISIDDAAQEYRQDFRPALYGVAAGVNLEVQVFLSSRLVGSAQVIVVN